MHRRPRIRDGQPVNIRDWEKQGEMLKQWNNGNLILLFSPYTPLISIIYFFDTDQARASLRRIVVVFFMRDLNFIFLMRQRRSHMYGVCT